MYIELVQFGCGKGVSPGLESRVTRQAAFSLSFELARQELEREGLKLKAECESRASAKQGHKAMIREVLDCCNAIHHISLASAAFGLNDGQRVPLYRNHRTLLRNGQWRLVVREQTELSTTDPENDKMQTEIAYLRKHGNTAKPAGLRIPTFAD